MKLQHAIIVAASLIALPLVVQAAAGGITLDPPSAKEISFGCDSACNFTAVHLLMNGEVPTGAYLGYALQACNARGMQTVKAWYVHDESRFVNHEGHLIAICKQ